jgi:hypothetical protein
MKYYIHFLLPQIYHFIKCYRDRLYCKINRIENTRKIFTFIFIYIYGNMLFQIIKDYCNIYYLSID